RPAAHNVALAARVRPQKLGLGAGGNFLAHRRDELPDADEMLAGGIVGHVASFNASPRRSKVPLAKREARCGGRSPRECMLPLQLCAITLTNQKPARLIRLTKTRAMAFMTMRCRYSSSLSGPSYFERSGTGESSGLE